MNKNAAKESGQIGVLRKAHRVYGVHEGSEEFFEEIREKYRQIDIGQLQKANYMLQKVLFESKKADWYIHIRTLAKTLDWVYSHSVDTALISAIIAINLGYSDNEIYDVILGGLLHDIGLLLIPKCIVNKEDRWTEEEQIILNKHAELGSSMIDGENLPGAIRNIISQHHGILNANGFRDKSRYHEVDEISQIVMIADLIDMTTSCHACWKNRDAEEQLQIIIQSKEKYKKGLIELLIVLYQRCNPNGKLI